MNIFFFISFPIEVNASIYSFVVHFDNEHEIHIELKEKNLGKITEDDSSNLFEENDQIKEIFTINLGMLVNIFISFFSPLFKLFSLKSNSQCQIEIKYITELD